MRMLAYAVVGGYLAALVLAGSHAQASGLSQTTPVRRATAQQPDSSGSSSSPRPLLDRYCVSCHNQRLKTGGLALDTLDTANVGAGAEVWEKVVRKLRGGLMPPAGRPRPDQASYDHMASWLEAELDRAAMERPNPGRTDTFHRLNRAEYRNAIRDLLALDVDVTSMLPDDDTGYGFDNNAGVLKVNEAVMEQYLSAARKVSREAMGSPVLVPSVQTFAVKEWERQDLGREDLPFGTRGGIRVHDYFPQDAEYTIKVDLLCRGNDCDGSTGFPDRHELELTVDGQRVQLWTIDPGAPRGPKPREFQIKLPVKAGPRDITAAFLKRPSTTEVQSVRARFERPFFAGETAGLPADLAEYQPSVDKVTITGPFNPTGPGDTPSRRRILVCRPAVVAEERDCARKSLLALTRRAYRRPVADADLQGALRFYDERRQKGEDFESGIEGAIERVLVSPEFLFRVEVEPAIAATRVSSIGARANNYHISDLELASRLSFFLWSSIPDDQLIELASRGRLRDPNVLGQQVRRMLADHRSEALVSNFVGQWLQLRNLESASPSIPVYPDFDDTLRESFHRETELFFSSVLHENRSVMDLLTANYTFVDERLARQYEIPSVAGPRFRRVTLSDDNPRHGLGMLGQGSILTISSRSNRTSPVLRGKWILTNILGTPPPPPPPNVPALKETGELGGNRSAHQPTMRERMAQHRADAVCAACHSMIDPLGFALENFDGVGRWRDADESYNPIDASGTLPNGAKFKDVREFQVALVSRPERFAGTVTEKLMTYALGRGLEYFDMPSVRRIVHNAAPGNYTLLSLITGIVQSDPFVMRRRAETTPGALSAARQ
jgi:mono/diheme cytochrome c family protein